MKHADPWQHPEEGVINVTYQEENYKYKIEE